MCNCLGVVPAESNIHVVMHAGLYYVDVKSVQLEDIASITHNPAAAFQSWQCSHQAQKSRPLIRTVNQPAPATVPTSYHACYGGLVSACRMCRRTCSGWKQCALRKQLSCKTCPSHSAFPRIDCSLCMLAWCPSAQSIGNTSWICTRYLPGYTE